jgi:hypothetical protein
VIHGLFHFAPSGFGWRRSEREVDGSFAWHALGSVADSGLRSSAIAGYGTILPRVTGNR